MPAIEPPASLHFAAIVEQVISPVMHPEGFRVSERTDVSVQFMRADRAVSFSYSPEDLPSPWVSITVGLLPDGDARPEYVAVWRAIRGTGQSLPDLVVHPRRGPLRPPPPVDPRGPAAVRKPLWDEEGQIRDLIAQQHLEAQHHCEQVSRTQARSMARHVYDKGDLRGAVVAYGLIDPAHLTAADPSQAWPGDESRSGPLGPPSAHPDPPAKRSSRVVLLPH